MALHPSLLYVTDAAGNVQCVQIPWELWQKIAPQVEKLLPGQSSDNQSQVPEPLADFEDFLRFWDFRYPYDPAVRCPHCGAACTDWRDAPDHPFRLTNASLGGLLVFHCKQCGTTIRQKHFRDHVAYEHTTPKPE